MAPFPHTINVVNLEPVSDKDCGKYYEKKSKSSIVCAKGKKTYRVSKMFISTQKSNFLSIKY